MSLKDKKVAVAIAGIDVNIPSWKDIVWGSPKNGVFGRAPRTITVANDLQADLLIFNTGASKTPEGIVESEYTRKFTLERLSEIFAEDSEEFIRCKQLLAEAFVDTKSIDTFTSAEVAVRECSARGIGILVFVSDKTHSTRVIRDLNIARGEANLEVAVWSCDGGFGEPSFVAEAPINTSDPNRSLPSELQSPNLFSRTQNIKKADKESFAKDFAELLKRYKV